MSAAAPERALDATRRRRLALAARHVQQQLNETSWMMSRTRIAITPGRPSQPAAFSRSWLLPAAPTAGPSAVVWVRWREPQCWMRTATIAAPLTAALAPSMPLLRRRAA